MARRRQEIALQTEIETQEEWNEAVNKEGLTVADIYQSYGGPCKALEAKFRAIKNTLGDPLLYFVVAKADTIDALEKYRGRCEPLFLFYASGVLVDAVLGANAPELQRKIMSNLEREKKILKEGGTRNEFRFQDLEGEGGNDDEGGAQRHRSPSVVNAIASQQYTLAVIRPEPHAEGKTDEILDQIQQHGFKVLLQREHHFTEHDIRELHRYKMNEEGYEEHIQRMISSPSMVLLLQKTDNKESSVDEFRDLINANEAWKSMIDCTQSTDHVQNELNLLFPAVAPKSHSPVDKPLERTLAVIRPSALKLYKDVIIKRIEESGFEVSRTAEVQLTKEQVEQFYGHKKDKPYFNDLIQEMTSGPCLALYLVKRDAIEGFRTLLGPADKEKIKEATGTFRNEFDIVDAKINSLHGARSHAEVNRHLSFFFPEERLLVVLKPNLTDQQRSEIHDVFRKANFFILAHKMEKLTVEQAAQIVHAHQGKEYYDDMINYMTSGPSDLLVIAKEDAGKYWQDLVGPEDPAEASQKSPTSIRAMYGKDLVHNAIEVSPDAAKAKDDIHLLFGDLDQPDHAPMFSRVRRTIPSSISMSTDMYDDEA